MSGAKFSHSIQIKQLPVSTFNNLYRKVNTRNAFLSNLFDGGALPKVLEYATSLHLVAAISRVDLPDRVEVDDVRWAVFHTLQLGIEIL